MSANDVRDALNGFLDSRLPTVMVLTGRWGRGKTFLWQQLLRSRAESKALPDFTYSYVSLFGVETLAELRNAILASGVDATADAADQAREAKRPALKQLGAKLKRTKAGRLLSQRLNWKQDVPELLEKVDLGGLMRAILLRGVQGYLVCIDDIERRGEGLRMRDVLGYIATLRDERQCSVILILNDDELTAEDKTQFALLREKVFDNEVRYEPTPEDCVELVFPASDPTWATVRANCVRLGIENIRILQRVRQTYGRLEKELGDDAELVRDWLEHSVPVLVLAHYSKEDRHPSVEYVLGSGLGRLVRRATGEQKAEDREDWQQFLSEYGFRPVEVMDNLAVGYLRTGIIRAPQLVAALEEMRASVQRWQAEREFEEAWEMYSDSFEHNDDALLGVLARALRRNLLWTSPGNVSGTTTLFRELGRHAEADALVSAYVEALQREAPQILDLREYPFADRIGDAKLKEAMTTAYLASVEPVPLREAVGRLNDGVRWTARETEALERATVDEIVVVLHELRGRDLAGAVRGLLQFSSTGQPDYHLVKRRTLEALRCIEAESELNRLRMQRYYPLPVFSPPVTEATERAVD